MIRVSVSLIEWEGPEAAEGRIPAGARRVGKAALVTRPGQKATVVLGQEDKESFELMSGLHMTVEPNVGADGTILDLRLVLKARGIAEVTSEQGLTLRDGRAVLLSLGRVDGKSLAAVVEGTRVDMSGQALLGGEPR